MGNGLWHGRHTSDGPDVCAVAEALHSLRRVVKAGMSALERVTSPFGSRALAGWSPLMQSQEMAISSSALQVT